MTLDEALSAIEARNERVVRICDDGGSIVCIGNADIPRLVAALRYAIKYMPDIEADASVVEAFEAAIAAILRGEGHPTGDLPPPPAATQPASDA